MSSLSVQLQIDKEGADPNAIKTQLMSNDVLEEEFGGDAQCVLVSATKGIGLDELLKKNSNSGLLRLYRISYYDFQCRVRLFILSTFFLIYDFFELQRMLPV